MLRPRLPRRVVACSAERLNALHTQRRLCTTLGDIRAFMESMRATHQLNGGAIQLCITEDMQLHVEHRIDSSRTVTAGSSRVPALEAIYQGSSSTTVAEALRSLQLSPTSVGGTTACSSSSPPPPPPARTSPSATVVDLTRIVAEEARALIRHVEVQHPNLKVVVRHTSGQDLQGTRLHTFSVGLAPRGGATGMLSENAQALVERFKGESVGEGYNGALRRALQDAYAAAAMALPTTSVALAGTTAASSTVLALFASTWEQDGFRLQLTTSALTAHPSVECAVRHSSTGQLLRSTSLAPTVDGLRDLLSFCDGVSAAYNADRDAVVRRRLRDAPLHLLLPRTALRVKDLLRKLLYYYYGCLDSDVTFDTVSRADGVFTTKICVTLPPSIVFQENAMPPPVFVVAKTSGTSRRRVAQLAAVQAMEALFPELFAQQIAYHADVREIQQSAKAAAGSSAAPHISRGLEAQLTWALQSVKADFVVESVLLKQNTPYPMWGVRTALSSAWLSQLYVIRHTPVEKEVGGAGEASSVRELCVHAFDSKKNRCEQKVVAAALAKLFPEACKAAVEVAVERQLIDAAGKPTSYDGVQRIDHDAAASGHFAAALSSDPCLAQLTPSRTSELQPLPESPARDSALEKLWFRLVGRVATPVTVRVQRGDFASGYIATCTTAAAANTSVESGEEVLCRATASTEIAALLALAAAAQTAPAVCGGISTAAGGSTLSATTSSVVAASSVAAAAADTMKKTEDETTETEHTVNVLAAIPSALPASTPLQTCVEAVGRLYGLRCAVRVSQDGVEHAAELWGSFPVDSALLRKHETVVASPFFLDRSFLLGRGRAESPLMAVVQAAANVFETHVRVHMRGFQETVVRRGQLHLNPSPQCALANLCDGVVAEIKATSDRPLTEQNLVVSFEPGQLCTLAFTVCSGKQSINLETVATHALLDCTRELCQRISAETGAPWLAASALMTIVCHTPAQLLRELCRLAYGFVLRAETKLVHKTWHCRLSVAVTEEVACCLVEASAGRKKEAEDVAACSALHRYFAEELPRVPASESFSTARRADSAPAESKVDMDSYFFCVSEGAEGADNPSTAK